MNPGSSISEAATATFRRLPKVTAALSFMFATALGASPGVPSFPLQVFGLDPLTGAVVSGPVSISGPVAPSSDGFTVLANGNFLINNRSCTYNQFNPTTGAMIPATTITVTYMDPNPVVLGVCTGVTTNGVHLFFQTGFNSFTETDLTGFVIATKTVTQPFRHCTLDFVDCVEGISLVTFGASGVPGKPSCNRKTLRDWNTSMETRIPI